MENPAENSKRHPLNDLMQSTMDRIREMVDTNPIVGQPITTPDGVTLIPISKVSFGFGSGGADYGKTTPKENFGGGSAAGVRIDPVAFLVIREGNLSAGRSLLRGSHFFPSTSATYILHSRVLSEMPT